MNTNLSLEVSDTLNPKTMRIFDTSCYHTDEIIDNYLVEILPVNKSVWLPFLVKKDFTLILNSSNLKYKIISDKSMLMDLPDGIYEFKQSIKPNLLTLKLYYHLRVTDLKRKLQKQFCDLIDNKCNLSNSDFALSKSKLRDIDEFISAASWMVDECGDKARGKELYEYAIKLLGEYTNECQC